MRENGYLVRDGKGGFVTVKVHLRGLKFSYSLRREKGWKGRDSTNEIKKRKL